MGKSERRKGKAGEREVVNLARSMGLEAKRCWETAQSARAEDRGIDVIVHGLPYQVKRRGSGYKLVYEAVEDCGGAFIRQDGKPWLAVVYATEYLHLRKSQPVGPLK